MAQLDDNIGVAAADIANSKVDPALDPNPEESHQRLHQGRGIAQHLAAPARLRGLGQTLHLIKNGIGMR